MKTIVLGLALMLSTAVWADGPLVGEMRQYAIKIDEQGAESRQPIKDVVPGTLIEYEVEYKNVSEQPVTGFAVTLAVPEGTQFAPASLQLHGNKATVLAVAPGVPAHAQVPLYRTPAGKDKPVLVPEYEWTSVKVLFEVLAPKQAVKASYRVVVLKI